MYWKAHQKHANLTKPQGGKYHRLEFGLIGAPCPTIQKLCKSINDKLKSDYKIGYMDADHGSRDRIIEPKGLPSGQAGIGEPTCRDSGIHYHTSYNDKIDFHQICFHDHNTEYSLRMYFSDCDMVLVNGNHFQADKQVVIINEKKKESLERKLDRLTNVVAFILDEDMDSPFDFLKKRLTKFSKVPIFSIRDTEGIISLIHQIQEENAPSLCGLILTGGRSERMGEDKGSLKYHGKAQREYLADLLKQSCDDVKLSLRPRQKITSSYLTIYDTFTGLGPYGAILSAFRENPNRAYFTLPCDVPFIDSNLISQLISQRDTTKLATCFHNEETGFPEPLITIWEPRAYPRLLHFLSFGYSCPRKVLINSDVKELEPKDKLYLFNANTPDEAQFAQSKIKEIAKL